MSTGHLAQRSHSLIQYLFYLQRLIVAIIDSGMKLYEGDFPHLQILLKDLRFRFLQQISILSAGNMTKLMIRISVNSKINVISSREVYPTVLTKPLGENDDNR